MPQWLGLSISSARYCKLTHRRVRLIIHKAEHGPWLGLFWDTLSSHSCGKIQQDTFFGHSCTTLSQNTLVGRSFEKLAWDTLVEAPYPNFCSCYATCPQSPKPCDIQLSRCTDPCAEFARDSFVQQLQTCLNYCARRNWTSLLHGLILEGPRWDPKHVLLRKQLHPAIQHSSS